MITHCFNTQNTFGKNPDQLVDIIKIFVNMFADYPIRLLRWAFEDHIRESRDFPTPADIRERLHRDFEIRMFQQQKTNFERAAQ